MSIPLHIHHTHTHKKIRTQSSGSSITFSQCDALSIICEAIESLSIEIFNEETKNTISCLIYRPPNGDFAVYGI